MREKNASAIRVVSAWRKLNQCGGLVETWDQDPGIGASLPRATEQICCYLLSLSFHIC